MNQKQAAYLVEFANELDSQEKYVLADVVDATFAYHSYASVGFDSYAEENIRTSRDKISKLIHLGSLNEISYNVAEIAAANIKLAASNIKFLNNLSEKQISEELKTLLVHKEFLEKFHEMICREITEMDAVNQLRKKKIKKSPKLQLSRETLGAIDKILRKEYKSTCVYADPRANPVPPSKTAR